jgi:DNA-binding PadR family transcriptional regulator
MSLELTNMWPQEFTIFETFTEKIHQLLLLNTIQQSPEGLAFSDFKEMGCEAPTKVYRILKKLEEDGYLTTQTTPQSSGRPKQPFILTSSGVQKLQELRDSLREILEGIRTRFPEKTRDLNIPEFLEKGTFHHFGTPGDFILQNDSIPVEKKRRILTEMEKMLSNELNKIRAALQQLGVTE